MFDIAQKEPLATRRQPKHTIKLLPINLFAAIMGLAGLSLAWREATKLHIVGGIGGETVGWLAVIAFLALSIGYGSKFILHPSSIVAEYTHPVMNSFFGTISISILLLSAFLQPYNDRLGQLSWVFGVVLAFITSYAVMQRFLTGRHRGEDTLPTLLIPGVATLDIAVTGSKMPYSWAHDVNMLAFAVGSVIAAVLVVMIFSRLRHHESVSMPMRPSLLILVAPFAVGFLAYTNISGRVDMFASSLYYFGLFLLLVLVPQVFRSGIPFSVNWWAIGFPVAAFSIASFRFSATAGGVLLQIFSVALFAALAGAIALLFVRTLVIILSGRLFCLGTSG